jgi:AcrR family transcriptional regulator
VSRTALYRHFADKQALLDEVAAEGFRMLREALREAWGRGGRAGFDEMGPRLRALRGDASVALPA